MRVGIVTGEYPPMRGGISTQTHRLVEALAQAGDTVFVYTDRRAADRIKGVSLSASVTGWRLLTLRDLRRWVRENRLDVVNLHYQTAAYRMSPFIHFLPEALPVPVVATFHDLRFPYLFPKAGKLRDWIVMRLARASAGVIATNQEDLARLDFHSNHALIPIGSNVDMSSVESDDDDQLQLPQDAFVLAFFGFVNHTKGLEDLLAAIAALRDTALNVHLLMIGERLGSSDPTNAAYAETIDVLIDDLSLTAYVHWTGYADDMAVGAYLTKADAVVMPFRDGASYRRSSLIVALHHGCAVITTQPAVEIPAFQHEVNMLLVRSGDVPALTATIERLYNNPSLRQELQRGARRLSAEFSWERITRSYRDFFRRVIESAT